MKKILICFVLFFFSSLLIHSAMTTPPEDWLGRVNIPTGTEVEVLKFKTNEIVYAGTNGSGLYVSYDAGSSWAKLTGFPAESPCVKDLIFDSMKNMYAATYGGGIYYSKDNGATWIPKSSGIKNLHIQALTITKEGKLICGTYGGGIYYSDDGGNNWVRTDKGLRYDNITCLTTLSNGFIVAGTYGGGFYVSRDTCKTWLVSNTLLTNVFINDFAKDPAGHLYAATNGAGAMMTGDGITWHLYSNKFHYKGSSDIKPLLDTAITAVGANGYQQLIGTRSAGMYFFDEIWNCWQNSGDFTVGITACDVSPNGTILATRSKGDVTRSTDNGATWTETSTSIVNINPTDYADTEDYLNVYPSSFDQSIIAILRSGTLRTVYKSTNHGNDWENLGTFTTAKINDVEMLANGDIFIAAREGIIASTDGGKTFKNVCKPTDLSHWDFTDIEYDSSINTWVAIFMDAIPVSGGKPTLTGRIYQSSDSGKNWTYQTFANQDVNTLKIDKSGTWYLNLDVNFVRSTDHGANFIPLFTSVKGKLIYGRDGNLYYSDNSNNLYVSKKYSPTFTKMPFSPEGTFAVNSWTLQKMACDIYGNFYVGIRNSTLAQGLIYEVYKTSDYGKNWQNLRVCFNLDLVRTLCSDEDGYTYLLTDALYKVIDSNSLKPPKTTAPTNAKMGEEINPIFAWERAKFAEEYELQIDQTDLFYSPFETNVTGDTTCQAVLDLKYNTEYYWRIRSKTHHAHSAWTVGSFTVGMEPPFLISPEKGKSGVPLNAGLTWHKIEDATHYMIQVAEDENFTKIVFENDNNPDTTITTDRLVGLKVYYWRVKAFTKVNASRWSEVWNFRTIMGPPVLIYPANNSIDRMLSEQFNWHKVPEAETYYIQVATDSAFANLFFEASLGADTFKTIDNMLPETDYYWHVASLNSQGKSEYSEIWQFRTSLKPVELRVPENKTVNLPLDVDFAWLEHNSGSQYQIQISKDVDFKTIVDDQKVNNLLEFQSNKLEYYKTYYWRVRLLVGTRVGLWSVVWSFKTGIQSADLLNPPDKSVDQPNTLKFKWYEVTGAKFYQLQISKNDKFTDLVYSMDSLTKAEQYVEDLEPEILYYWRVRAWNEESYGTSQWSPVWTFTTGKVTLILRTPKTGSTGVSIPTLLMWYQATTAEYYHLQVANDAGFANIVFDKDSIHDIKLTLTKNDLTVNTNYYWRVKGVSEKYTTPWSETWQFTTAETSVKESQLFSSIKLYPNPTNGKAELSISYKESCDAEIQISTAGGKIIKTDVIRLLLGETRYGIDVDKLTSGSYYITIITTSGYITRELVVVK